MYLPEELYCPEHHLLLTMESGTDLGKTTALVCTAGCRLPVVGGIPRFVDPENYASSFGLQWKKYRQTQLDSYTGRPYSHDRLERIAGGDLSVLRGRKVLEVGCGAGRFTEVLLAAGAIVCSVDLSTAVEAAYQNCGSSPNYFVCQADMLKLPFQPEQFDVVLCIGVLQHTPDPEISMAALCKQVRPGGELWIDHYAPDYPATFSRRLLRRFLTMTPSGFSLRFSQGLVAALWPMHRLLWRLTQTRIGHTATWVRSQFVKISPVADYHYHMHDLGPELLRAWAMLDTHDTLTDVYKHLRTTDQIATHLKACGMEQIHSVYDGNGVEARCRKPAQVPARAE